MPQLTESVKADGSVNRLPIRALHLDHENPRFGGKTFTAKDEGQIVDEIIGQYGIVDVISSIATNAYFDSEPLVGAVNKGHGKEVTILEGNRRLVACLVLSDDPRAKHHGRMRQQYPQSKLRPNAKIPVQVYDWRNSEHRNRLLPYLGVRHVVGIYPWDSFAKAAWVAETLRHHAMDLDGIKRMIGDDQDFTDRILEGYHFVQQVRSTNAYDAAESLRKGRGSFQLFPFSWVYTALGYKNIRDFVGLPKESRMESDPVDDGHLQNAGTLMRFMFGGAGRAAVIEDSRQIGALARALGNPEAAATLRRGGSLEEAEDATRPPQQYLLDLLDRADRAVADGIRLASGLGTLDMPAWVKISESVEKLGNRFDRFQNLIDGLKPSARRKSRKE